ncbi:BppU family phage baseplate upper protein [Enterococcus avium]|uniref:BppU family phage baseplate upper protein n=2 Tax=Enterococcus avium TaxID=33945 RepID=UPI001F5AD894|nr:BppU family phage baseplate upper protein [Enterococcus avium]
MSNKILNLDLSKDPIMPAIVYGRVGDDRLQTVTVNLARRDEVADLTGYDITFEGTTYNRQTKVFDSNNISSTPEGLKKGTFDYTFPNMAFAVAGKYEQAYFSIVKDGKRDSTAGFEIYVDGNADIDAPEAETIITEYNILVTELNELQKQAITELNKQQNQAINEMNQNFTAAQERIAELEVQINDLRNKIDQALTDFENGNFWTKEESFNKEESSANVIYQVIGKEKAEITFRLDAKSEFVKVSSVGYTTLLSPTNVSWTPLTEEQLNNLSSLDGSLYSARDVAANYMKQLKYDCDILGFFKSFLGEKFFTIRGATTDSQKVEVLESLITDFTSNVYGYGSGGGINKLTHRNWNGTWTVSDSTAANEVTRIGQTIESTDTNWKKLINGGKISVLSNSEPTISPNYSTVNIDYLCLDVTIELSANEHFEYMIAANHGEKIATKEEALDGKSNDKIMTPLRVADVISTLGSGGNAVASSEEALAGVENTKIMSALRVKEVLDARENEIATSNVFSAAFMRSGQISFMRRGPILIVNGTVTVKTAQAALTDLFVPDLGGKVPLNNAGNILAISDKAPYAKRFLISSNGGNFRTISALEADEYLAFSGSIMLAP